MPAREKETKSRTTKSPRVAARSRTKTQTLPDVSVEKPLRKEIVLEKVASGGGKKSDTTPSSEDIAKRAYEIWEEEGCPTGCEEQHWLQAEEELSV